VKYLSDDKRFCVCCGLSKARILEKLETLPFKPVADTNGLEERSDGLHVQNQTHAELHIFGSRRHIITCCEFCGVLLQERDFRGEWDFAGSDGGRPQRHYITTGYNCHNCGAEATI